MRRRAFFGVLAAPAAIAGTPRFRFELLRRRPAFDLTPDHARMCSCYRDRAGVYHLFVDYIPAEARTIASWTADIRYYRSPDLRRWRFMGNAVARGRWRGSTEASDLDWYGVASPNIFVNYGRAMLFYAGREHGHGPGAPRSTSLLRCRIFLAEAPIGSDGGPSKRFEKRGVVLDRGIAGAWDDLRLDDPCAVRLEDTVHLYYKGLCTEGGLGTRRIGHARAIVGRREFFKDATPDLSAPGGTEMPRVFRYDGGWHMFLRHFRHDDGARWRHYVSPDSDHWMLHDTHLFDGAGREPGRGATDVALVRGIDGELARPITALATGMEDGVLKLWAYRVEVV